MIYANNLSKKYNDKVVLDDIHLDIDQGEIVGLVGPNGVGKTTLLSILMGLIKPDEGEVVIADIENKETEMYRKVGFMQDNTVLYPHMTGYDHLAYIAFAHGLPKESIEEVSQMVGNIGYIHQRVEEYSLGMKQHLLFACAIIHQPEVLLLDEPFNGLDPTSLIRIRDLIIELNQINKVTILLSSHNLTEIDRMTQKIFFLNEGHIIHKQLQDYTEDLYIVSLNRKVVVDPTQKGIEQLTSTQILVNGELLDSTIKRFSELGVQIVAIDREKIGSERLYRDIYAI